MAAELVTSDARNSLAAEHAPGHHAQHHRRQQIAGLCRGNAQHALHEQWQVDHDSKHAHAKHEHGNRAHADHGIAEQRQRDQRFGGAFLNVQERRQHHDRCGQQRIDACRRPAVVGHPGESEQQRHHASNQGDYAGPIDAPLRDLRTKIRKFQVNRRGRDQAHRQVHVKNRAPGHMIGQPASERRPEHRSNTPHGRKERLISASFRGRKNVAHDGENQPHHRSGADPLQPRKRIN